MRIKAKGKYHDKDGIQIPSVTTALGELAKPALIKWANRIGLEGIELGKYKDHLADIGTLTHYLIICSLKEEEPYLDEYTPEQVRMAEACFEKFNDWFKINPVRPIIAEEPLVSEQYKYGGTIDLYALCRKDLLLVDFKTNAIGVFPEMIYQVSAYRQLLREKGYLVSRAIILRLGRGTTEGAEERTLTAEEMDNGFEIFKHTLAIHKLKSRRRA
jgi:hypothetical protein